MELGKTFDPKSAEEHWFQRWIDLGYFKADPSRPGPVFSIVIPPPNVTGQLHLGHALNVTLHDVIVRTRRMQGYNTLWLPGTDHAGIATQNVVERELAKEGKSRHDLGREAFVARVWQWRETYGGRILNQLRRLGASCDWSRERFTLDPGLSRAVTEVFVRLYREGLIYRALSADQLVPAMRDGASRPRSRSQGNARQSLVHQLSARRRLGRSDRGDDAARDDAGRHRRGRPSRRRALQGDARQEDRAAADRTRNPDHRRSRCRSRFRLRARSKSRRRTISTTSRWAGGTISRRFP